VPGRVAPEQQGEQGELVNKITAFISDDHAILREGLRVLLEASGDIEVVGEAENGHRVVGEVKRLQPNVVLMDIAMPLLNGVEATRRIAQEAPATRVLILSSYSDDGHVQSAIEGTYCRRSATWPKETPFSVRQLPGAC
jgi:DNA-binding NarL/FixJ family response regulator